jgi:predicted glycoside hydrolase/deacetylase ChbG (UPF0249 family)
MFNADDFGLTEGVCRGIVEAMGSGVLDRASIPSIVSADGEFPRTTAGVVGVDLSHVRAERSAQIDRLRSWGVEPSHMDSHHHIGVKPHVVQAYAALAVAMGLPARSTLEVMCHPAYADSELAARSAYIGQRERGLGVLTSGKLLNGLRALDVEIGSMANLASTTARLT